MRHGLLHHARGFDHLRQEHFAFAEQIADDVHAVHQRAFDHLDRFVGGEAAFFGVFVDELGDAMHQRVRQTLAHRQLAPCEVFFFFLAVAFELLGDFEQALGRVGATVEHHVFDALFQLRVQVGIYAELAGVDNAHIHPRCDGVVEEYGVNRFAHRLVTTE